MYDLSSKFNVFYNDYVVLSQEEQNRLHHLKNVNLNKLKDGIEEYNQENVTEYEIINSVVQGSIAMHTVTRNDNKDYDIDNGVIFEKDALVEKNGCELGTTKVKNICANSLNRKVNNFKKEPETKTNCVRVQYADGLHIDFAIYRKCIDENGQTYYEHCGSEWRKRDPWAINNWFEEINNQSDRKIRKVVRLLKMFCKSRDHWRMPGGLIQTVLIEECFKNYSRIDEMFYYTLVAIRDRLNLYKEVYNPTDKTLSLILKESDREKIDNLYKRLDKHLLNLEILFDDDCSEEDALNAWALFFEHNYWYEQLDINNKIENKTTEQFIGKMFKMDLKYKIEIECMVTQNGFRRNSLKDILKSGQLLQTRKELDFQLKAHSIPKPYDIYWKVKNQGEIAKQKRLTRGEIVKTNKQIHQEATQFKGEHYVECYIVKNNLCVAKTRIDVPIETVFKKNRKTTNQK